MGQARQFTAAVCLVTQGVRHGGAPLPQEGGPLTASLSVKSDRRLQRLVGRQALVDPVTTKPYVMTKPAVLQAAVARAQEMELC